jgi:predicted nucleic acid-binding Zn finger protein
MTEREKLAHMIYTEFCELVKDGDWKFEDMVIEVAKRLLKKNVIVLPCKAGDTVYIKGAPAEVSFIHIEKEITYCVQIDCGTYDCDDCPFYEDEISWEGEHDCKHHGYIEFNDDDIGKTVFLTRGEAEQALNDEVK